MITRTIGGVAGTLFQWTQAGTVGTNLLGNGSGNIVYSPAIACRDAEQLFFQMVFAPSPLGTAVIARLRWSTDLATPVFLEEVIRTVGALGAVAQQMTPWILEEGPLNTPWVIERPASASYVKIGFYSNGVPTAGDTVTVSCELQRGGQLQAGG